MIMKEKMIQVRVAAVNFLQVPEGENGTRCALSFIQRQRSVLCENIDGAKDLGFHACSFGGLKGHKTEGLYVASCLQLFFNAILNCNYIII